MKERPIIFSGPMVRAILEGRKTQTRRVVKQLVGFDDVVRMGMDLKTLRDTFIPLAIGKKATPFLCPYGQPGDRLWVREKHQVNATGIKPNWNIEGVLYAADGAYIEAEGSYLGTNSFGLRWTPPIHMPRWASRITLEIVSVRVERLQDISVDDCKAEGITKPNLSNAQDALMYAWGGKPDAMRVPAFRELWESIKGHKSWDANPWVWVIEFKKIEQSK
jgi:hypothetical protein